MTDVIRRSDKTIAAHFHLERLVDETGMSGIGHVAEGVVLPNHTAVLWWCCPPYSVQVYRSTEELIRICGHGDKQTTKLVWDFSSSAE